MSGRILGVTGMMMGFYLVWIAMGYGELTNGINEFCGRISGGAPLASRDTKAQSKEEEIERDDDVEPYLEVVGTIGVGVSSAFWAFRRLQAVQGRGRNVCLFILMFSFALCAYGFGLLLELAAEGG